MYVIFIRYLNFLQVGTIAEIWEHEHFVTKLSTMLQALYIS